MELASDFDAAVSLLSAGELIDDIYYIVGGASSGQGVVVARDRNKPANTWKLGQPGTGDLDWWYRLETNYDHENPVPVADDRRTPGNAALRSLGQANLTKAVPGGLWTVMTHWPTFNQHTDYTVVMSASDLTYQSYTWIEV